MPIINPDPNMTPHLVYDAPINEKTKELREKFDIDEETGYQRHYNWRNMARLGKNYKYEDPIMKFDPYDPRRDIPKKVTIAVFSVIGCGVFSTLLNYSMKKPLSYGLHRHVIAAIVAPFVAHYSVEYTTNRQAIKNAAIVDYTRKHPERFSEIERPKFREVLYVYQPVR